MDTDRADLPPKAAPREGADRPTIRTWWLGIIAVLLIAMALKASQWVTMPLAFAFIVAMCLTPVDGWVAERMPGRLKWLGKVAAMAIVLLVIAVFVGGIIFVARSVIDSLPTLTDQLREKIPGQEGNSLWGEVRRYVSDVLGTQGSGGGSGSSGSQPAGGLIGELGTIARTIASSVTTLLAMAAVIFFFTLLMLTERDRWRSKLSCNTQRGGTWDRAFAAAAQRFRWYLLVRTVLGLVTAVLYAGWLMVFGVDLVPVWFILTFLLNFVPTVGSLISGVLPFIFALATKDLGTAFFIGAGLVVIEQVMGNYVDPRMQGKELSLSPLVLLSSLLFWGYLWGLAGTLIAVPLTVFAVIILARFDPLRPIALFLSNENDFEALDRQITPD